MLTQPREPCVGRALIACISIAVFQAQQGPVIPGGQPKDHKNKG